MSEEEGEGEGNETEKEKKRHKQGQAYQGNIMQNMDGLPATAFCPAMSCFS